MPSLNLLIGSSGEIEAACNRENVSYDLEEIWRIPHTEFSPRVSQTVLDAAEAVEADHQAMVSGAGHDATYLNEITDAAMIFVPVLTARLTTRRSTPSGKTRLPAHEPSRRRRDSWHPDRMTLERFRSS